MQMTWPGAPTIYYGDEAGVCGFTDPDNRRTYPWGREDHVMIAFHREMIRIHKENKEFLAGSMKPLLEGSHNLIAYARFNLQGVSIIVVNNNNNEVGKEITVWHLGVPRQANMKRLILTDEAGFNIEAVDYHVMSGKVTVVMPALSAIVLRYARDEETTDKKRQGNSVYFAD